MDSLERAVLVYTTFPSIGEAEQAGQALLERRLCACVNILPGMVSFYWWKGGNRPRRRGGDAYQNAGFARGTGACGGQDAALLYDAGEFW